MAKYEIRFQKDEVLITIDANSNLEARKIFNKNISITKVAHSGQEKREQ